MHVKDQEIRANTFERGELKIAPKSRTSRFRKIVVWQLIIVRQIGTIADLLLTG